jgi:hypothetical protein
LAWRCRDIARNVQIAAMICSRKGMTENKASDKGESEAKSSKEGI